MERKAISNREDINVLVTRFYEKVREDAEIGHFFNSTITCLLYTSPSPRDQRGSRMPSSA